MKFEDILKLWDADCFIDPSNIALETLKTPQLHSKYYNIFIRENLLLEKLNTNLKEIVLTRWKFYNKLGDDSEYKNYEGNFFELKLLKSEKDMFFECDSEILTHKEKIAAQKEKVECLKEILKQINNRTFQIKNFIDMKKIESGI
jgi:hypothetical protein